ncbi:MAG: zinc ribbon domain-containing protein [Ardenticatenaceae bacterium]|nr:zinc ribbon domain-containing protein [Ardenticatenaceae bacterium]
MSKEITCKTCGYQNPHSSKFCNNCGAKLPLSTHIICPNCETPNTRDRVFCDTCGTRLVPETTQLKPEEPETSQPPSNEPFSLPVRPPGETGELNPNAVPDWLRTGDISSSKGSDETASEDHGKKGTSDLPDWLVHDSDPEPIINAPTTISTEFYQDLLEEADDLPQPDDLFPDEDEANLPDWLADADDLGIERDATESSADEEASAGLTGWLSDLEDGVGEADTAVAAEADDDVSSGLTDWLHELDDLSDLSPDEPDTVDSAIELDELLNDLPDEEEDSSDWLQELGPVQTDVLPAKSASPQEDSADDLPDWMDELGPLQTNLLDPSQIAELTGPLAISPDDSELIDDEEAGADASFTDLFETSAGETSSLPDWLDTAVEDVDTFLKELPDEEAADAEVDKDWFTADELVAETDLDWLSETGNLETVAEEDADVPDFDLGFESEDVAEAWDAVDELTADEAAVAHDFAGEDDAEADDFSWLADMEAIATGALTIEPEPEETAVAEEETIEPEEMVEDLPEPVAEAADDDDGWTSDTFFAETAVGEDLPDWLDQLDKPEDVAKLAEEESPAEELPDWIASMRPSQGFIGSELPGVFSDIDLRDTLEGIPEELAGAELPEWLQDTPLDSAPSTPFVETDKEGPMEIPDWLQPAVTEPEGETAAPGDAVEPPEPSKSRQEWRSLLEELPPLTPLAESLPKAEIPEWVQQLKPPELTGEPPREPEGPEELSGPLKGMQGIVTIEPSIAQPREAMRPTPYITTPEQQQQVALLRQLTQEVPQTVTTIATKTAYSTAVWLRLTLAILLIAALLVGLRGPSLVSTSSAVPANVQAVATAVSAAAGQPVLLAVEYTPAMAGELSPQAELLLNQLAANGSPVLMTSQYAAGTAVASSLTADTPAQMVGYLPGESIGLRQLGDCLAGRNTCEQLNGRMLDEQLKTNLSQTTLVIVLTGDRDNLVNWIEQVGSVATDVTLVAGTTQALAPLAKSYTSTNQLGGLLGGAPDSAAYQQLAGLPEGTVQSQLNAQIYGQLLAGTLLFVGLLAYGLTGFMNNRRGQS